MQVFPAAHGGEGSLPHDRLVNPGPAGLQGVPHARGRSDNLARLTPCRSNCNDGCAYFHTMSHWLSFAASRSNLHYATPAILALVECRSQCAHVQGNCRARAAYKRIRCIRVWKRSGPARNAVLASGKFGESLITLHCHRAFANKLMTSAAQSLRCHANSQCRKAAPRESSTTVLEEANLKLSWAAEVSSQNSSGSNTCS